MTGLDKIINQILDEANNSAGQIQEDARKKADEMMSAARAEAEKAAAEIFEKSEMEQGNYRERMKSAADLQRRTEILKTKQEIISQVMEKAYQKFCAMEKEEYFATLLKMLEKFAQKEEGILYLSEADLKALPADFADKAKKIAGGRGGSLSISEESRNIDRGFVLAYGGIEENCSFKALFDSRKDELQDKVQAILFS